MHATTPIARSVVHRRYATGMRKPR